MIGLVIVSHSAKLAEGVCDLARQVAQGKVRIAAAGGTADPRNPIGTDAFQVLEAIHSVYSEDGVLVLMDLGSAVLSAETALELLDQDRQSRVRLCAAPLVEGAVAAASLAAAGASLEEIAIEAQNALAGKTAELGVSSGPPQPAGPSAEAGTIEEALVRLTNRLGLHARPAAKLIRKARQYGARVTLENVTEGTGPVSGDSINGVLGLGARQGHQLRIRARGPAAQEALATLAGFIESGCGEKEESVKETVEPLPPPPVSPGQLQLSGIAAAAGIAIGQLVRLRHSAVEITPRADADPEAERQRLMAAIEIARDETRALYEWSKAHIGADEAGIFDAQLLFLEDPELIGGVSRILAAERVAAESAWQRETTRLADRLGALGDAYLGARAVDVADVAARVLRKLTGQGAVVQGPREPAILSAHDLTPSEVKGFDPAMVLGLCLETGGASAHSTILARALGIPVVAGLGPRISAFPDGTIVALDGEQGMVWISPDADQVEVLEDRRRQWLATRQAAELERHKPAAMRDGRRIRILANINGVTEAAEALACGAEGVGVLRTEFLFLGRAAAPDEDEQTAAYRTIAESLGGRQLSIRALDIGGDKSLPYVEIGEEANPFLGWRGIRVMLSRRDLFRTQLRAILRAGATHAVELLLPMITSVSELRDSKAMVGAAEGELEREGIPFRKNIRIGVMIEVPAAVAVADQLAREASFFSIGSNDLIQYAMAADRTNARVASIADPFQPAVLRMIRQTIEAGRDGGIQVALCGELAADPLATPLLLGLGLEEFSVSAPLIPELKRAISRWSVAEAEAVAKEVLAMDSSLSARRLLLRNRGGV
jgi:phosphoenolpyruvate-protein phosphotransferase/dihydroxyacetone kinase phosphotransfer subunit